MRALPAPLRACAAEVAVRCAECPGPEAEGLTGELLGLFSGVTRAEREGAVPAPTAITLYLANLRRQAAGDPVRFRQEVRTTLLHELGHYLGLEEDDLTTRHLSG
jgi:predicted Zn-dependent protease with MMP-like domain